VKKSALIETLQMLFGTQKEPLPSLVERRTEKDMDDALLDIDWRVAYASLAEKAHSVSSPELNSQIYQAADVSFDAANSVHGALWYAILASEPGPEYPIPSQSRDMEENSTFVQSPFGSASDIWERLRGLLRVSRVLACTFLSSFSFLSSFPTFSVARIP